MTTKHNEQTMGDMLLSLESALDDLERRITAMQAEIDDLVAAGIENAHEYWRDGKYLTLVYPVDRDGNRRRVYIGNNPSAIEEAQAAVRRHAKWVKLNSQINVLRKSRLYAITSISNILYNLKGSQTNIWGSE